MAETELTTAEAEALAQTTDAATGLAYMTIGEKPHYHAILREQQRLAAIAAPLGLRVFKDGAATFGVRAGNFYDGDSLREYAGADEQALTVAETNYIYLTAAGALTVNITGFPVPSVTPHVPLASIVVGATSYDYGDITDCRDRAIFGIPQNHIDGGPLV